MIREGTRVQWKWGKGIAQGKVQDIFDHSVTVTIKGAKVTRNGNSDNPALFIKQENGNEVLKLQSEVERID